MKYYPVCLNIQGRRCVVIGGGEVGERKAGRLVESGAAVIVVGSHLTPLLLQMKEEGKIAHIDSDYGEEHIRDAFLVIGATDSDDVNETIARDARERGILANIVDDPDNCDFILPAILERGELLVAVSTSGKSPALAAKVRDEVSAFIGPEYEMLIEIMARLRQMVQKKGLSPEENKKLFEAVINSDIAERIRAEDWGGVAEVIRDLTGVDLDVRG